MRISHNFFIYYVLCALRAPNILYRRAGFLFGKREKKKTTTLFFNKSVSECVSSSIMMRLAFYCYPAMSWKRTKPIRIRAFFFDASISSNFITFIYFIFMFKITMVYRCWLFGWGWVVANGWGTNGLPFHFPWIDDVWILLLFVELWLRLSHMSWASASTFIHNHLNSLWCSRKFSNLINKITK